MKLDDYKMTSEELERKAKLYIEKGVPSERFADNARLEMQCVESDIEFLANRIFTTCGGSNLASLCDADYLQHDPELIAGMIEDIETTCDEILVHNALSMLRADLRAYAASTQLAERLAQ